MKLCIASQSGAVQLSSIPCTINRIIVAGSSKRGRVLIYVHSTTIPSNCRQHHSICNTYQGAPQEKEVKPLRPRLLPEANASFAIGLERNIVDVP